MRRETYRNEEPTISSPAYCSVVKRCYCSLVYGYIDDDLWDHWTRYWAIRNYHRRNGENRRKEMRIATASWGENTLEAARKQSDIAENEKEKAYHNKELSILPLIGGEKKPRSTCAKRPARVLSRLPWVCVPAVVDVWHRRPNTSCRGSELICGWRERIRRKSPNIGNTMIWTWLAYRSDPEAPTKNDNNMVTPIRLARMDPTPAA